MWKIEITLADPPEKWMHSDVMDTVRRVFAVLGYRVMTQRVTYEEGR